MTKNSTFKLTDDELAILEQLADEMRCSRTDVIRKALKELQHLRQKRRATADAFVEKLFDGLSENSTLMIGLDENLEPYATVDGRDARPDIVVTGHRISVGGEEYVRVLLVDPGSELRLDAGVIKASTGGWLALLKPFPVALAN
jgi:predicted transcriptional regulator